MKCSEGRSNAVETRFNTISEKKTFPECITSLLLLGNSQASDTQRVTVLVLAAPTNREIGASAPNDQFLQAVSYNAVSSIVEQCDTTAQSWDNRTYTVNANPAGAHN